MFANDDLELLGVFFNLLRILSSYMVWVWSINILQLYLARTKPFLIGAAGFCVNCLNPLSVTLLTFPVFSKPRNLGLFKIW